VSHPVYPQQQPPTQEQLTHAMLRELRSIKALLTWVLVTILVSAFVVLALTMPPR
jgi:hypothetical protein